ncbi:MAG: MFS transporter [Spirochaetes bacterium]|nr:MFS transporter [Spirochaetota bacterium]
MPYGNACIPRHSPSASPGILRLPYRDHRCGNGCLSSLWGGRLAVGDHCRADKRQGNADGVLLRRRRGNGTHRPVDGLSHVRDRNGTPRARREYLSCYRSNPDFPLRREGRQGLRCSRSGRRRRSYLGAAFGRPHGESWRAACLVLAVIAAAGGVVLALDRTIPRTKPEPRGNSASDFDRGRIVIFVLLMLIVTVNGFVYRAFMTMFPTHIGAEVPMQKLPSVLSGGLLASGILAFGMIGQYVAGVIADRVDRFRIYPIPVLASIPLMLLIGANTGWSLIFVSVAFSLLFFPVQPLENVILGHYVPPKFVSSMFGLKYVLIFGVGSLGSVFSGYVSETLGTPRVFTLLPVFSLVTLSLALVALWLRRKKTPELPSQ